MRAGARGYAIKGSDEKAVIGAVRAVARGEAIFGPEIADRMLRVFAGAPGPAARAFPELTERERDVLELLARGASTATIASRLSLSGKTVRNHLSSISNKLQVPGRAEAASRAREAGLGR
jgi:DNA-binding NarL/FixJ family response regulator